MGAKDDSQFLLAISPLKVTIADNRREQGSFTFWNYNNFPVCFKIMTTNPEALRITPRIGCIDARSKITITVYRVPGLPLREMENLLLLARHGPSHVMNQGQMQRLWRDVPRECVSKRMLRCVFSHVMDDPDQQQEIGSVASSFDGFTNASMAGVPCTFTTEQRIVALEKQQRMMMLAVAFFYVVLFLLLMYMSRECGVSRECGRLNAEDACCLWKKYEEFLF